MSWLAARGRLATTMAHDFLSDRTTLIDSPTQAGLVGTAAAADVGDYLLVAEGEERGSFFEVGEQEKAIGRMAPCEIVIQDKEISRRHCTVRLQGGVMTVTDLGSTNGTYLNGQRIEGSVNVPVGGVLQIGRAVLKYERRARKEVHAAELLSRDLAKARRYVESLLPAPIGNGPITADWIYLPSAQLGGDVFGYHALDDRSFAVYLVDVSGHGTEASMLAVAVMNVLRQRALPDTDCRRPADVATRLNTMFAMEEHGFMFFTLWYGVFDASRRVIDYCSAGHHPAFLLSSDRRETTPMHTANVPIGVSPDAAFTPSSARVDAGTTLYLFSDGVFEVVTTPGERWELDDFLPHIAAPRVAGLNEPERLHGVVRTVASAGPFDDDFSLLTVTFA